MKRVVVLGSTGSIGVQALEVIAGSEDVRVVGLSCGRNANLLLKQARTVDCADVAVAEQMAAEATVGDIAGLNVRRGPGAAAQLVREVEADLVLNAIVGFAGLEATLAALDNGTELALANKESLVCAGSLVNGLAARKDVLVLPVDSEHSALFQLIEAAGSRAVDSVVITGSGGPFRGRSREQLRGVTGKEALAHPTWSMGTKISIDSATLMNKGLEVIEAHHLFGLAYERIEVVLHPQSIVHALVRMVDGALLAHMGMPDMKVPIAYALHHPRRAPVDTPRLELVNGVSLDFGRPDERVFPAIRLAREAGAGGDACTCALNGANEVAVNAFLAGELPFLGITEVVAEVLAQGVPGAVGTYEDAVAVDEWARDRARQACAHRRGQRRREDSSL
jgi:1-deoxy-D-xylulose-5-phosphate reductoisomerase